jgi:hypothetical protein
MLECHLFVDDIHTCAVVVPFMICTGRQVECKQQVWFCSLLVHQQNVMHQKLGSNLSKWTRPLIYRANIDDNKHSMIANRDTANTENNQKTPNDTHHTIGRVCVYKLDECKVNVNNVPITTISSAHKNSAIFFTSSGKGGLPHR